MSTEHKSKLIETDFRKLEVLLGYNETIKSVPLRVEDFHGKHLFNDDEVSIELTSVEVCVKGRGIEILHLLTEKEKDYLISEINE